MYSIFPITVMVLEVILMRVAYVRVSSVDQNESRQREALAQYDIEKWYEEKISARDMNRPQLQEMLRFVREGDTVYIHDFSRLARSTKDLLEIMDELSERNVSLVSHKESLDTSSPTGKLMVTMIAAINEFEREVILDRQREGIAIAKREGKYKGRQPKKIDPELFEELKEKYYRREINKVQWAKLLGVTRPTLDRILKQSDK